MFGLALWTTLVNSKEAAQIRHQYNLNNGYEGSILRLDAPYQCKRSYNLQKFKDFIEHYSSIDLEFIQKEIKKQYSWSKSAKILTSIFKNNLEETKA